MQTKKRKASKILSIATFLKERRESSVYQLQRRFFKNNPADTIMSLRKTYGWKISSVEISPNRFTYKVVKVGKMPKY